MIVDDQPYDSKAIIGAAHGFQFPELGPLRPQDFSGGENTVAAKLRELGFRVRRDRVPQELSPLVLVQNEVSATGEYDHWQDLTGVQYHFPNQYRNRVIEGRPFVYYRGGIREFTFIHCESGGAGAIETPKIF